MSFIHLKRELVILDSRLSLVSSSAAKTSLSTKGQFGEHVFNLYSVR